MIRDALSVLPARPAVLLAPLLVVVVLFLYYGDRREKCLDIQHTRDDLYRYLSALDPGETFRLSDYFAFDWNKLRVVARVKPDSISDECPFDWNWSGDERERLIESGRLSVLVFGHRGGVVGYYELDRDRIAFDAVDTQLTPETASFRVQPASGDAMIVLSRIERDG